MNTIFHYYCSQWRKSFPHYYKCYEIVEFVLLLRESSFVFVCLIHFASSFMTEFRYLDHFCRKQTICVIKLKNSYFSVLLMYIPIKCQSIDLIIFLFCCRQQADLDGIHQMIMSFAKSTKVYRTW